MSIFHRIFGNREEIEYKAILSKIFNLLMDRIDAIEEREVRDFFRMILDAAERSLRGILFMAPKEFHFRKQMTKENIDFWLRRVSLALVSYSYYCYCDAPEVKENPDFADLINTSYKAYWERMFDFYNRIFGENISTEDIDHYAAGLKEDTEKGYSESGEMEKALELTVRDHRTIGTELLQQVWKEGVGSDERKVLFLGARIWQAHQEIVQPFLVKLLKGY